MLMKKSTQESSFCTDPEHWSVLEQIAREGARRLLQLALENEVNEYLEAHKDLKDEQGRRVVVKNGYHPQRDLISGLGPLTIQQSRVDDRRLNNYSDTERFSSKILPRYLKKDTKHRQSDSGSLSERDIHK